MEANAAIIEDTADVETLLAPKYGWLWPAYNFLMAATRRLRYQPPPESVTVKLMLR